MRWNRWTALAVTAFTALAGCSDKPARASVVRTPDNTTETGGNLVRKEFTDNLEHPLGRKQAAMKDEALRQMLASGGRQDVRAIGRNRFVELAKKRHDRIFVVLVEFGDQAHPEAGDEQTNPGATTPGPLHNALPEPDRENDNTSIWQADYSPQHYRDLYFDTAPGAKSMVNYYREQSRGLYSFDGDVTDWVKVPYNEARYGHNQCGQSTCLSIWNLIEDAINVWTEQQLASGKTPEEVKEYLKSFDVWDRYDYDHDGDFNEPDGYIDHFQIVHAGEDEAVGGGAEGDNAIWSHRWYAFSDGSSALGVGPASNPLGGTRFGDLDMWVGDYTVQPENGGLGVFAHEYAHDLGLPDQYDFTNRATNVGSPGTELEFAL